MRAHTLRERVRVVTLPTGDTALVVDTEPPEDAPQPIREGFARRAMVNGGGTCPCGAGMTLAALTRALEAGGIGRMTVAHDRACPAADDALRDALDAWMVGGPDA